MSQDYFDKRTLDAARNYAEGLINVLECISDGGFYAAGNIDGSITLYPHGMNWLPMTIERNNEGHWEVTDE
jgi:hypothetical protein